jgi:hypothetical protein
MPLLSLGDAREKLEDWRRDLYELRSVKTFGLFPSLLQPHLFRRACIRACRRIQRLDLYSAGNDPNHDPILEDRTHTGEDGTKLQLGEGLAISSHGHRPTFQLPVGS